MPTQICKRCGHPHANSDVVDVHRFDHGRPVAYFARPIGRTFPTRDDAQRAICDAWAPKGDQ